MLQPLIFPENFYQNTARQITQFLYYAGVCKGTVCLSIQWVEDTLTKDGVFGPARKKILKRKSASIQYVVVYVTESPIPFTLDITV
jgi:hypothetical protein